MPHVGENLLKREGLFMNRKSLSRREFLNRSAGTVAGIAAGTVLMPGKAPAAANGKKKFVVGIMGCGGRCTFLLNDCLAKRPDMEIAYVCDIDANRLGQGVKLVEKLTGKKPKAVSDFRQMLDDKDVHAMFSITPDHWHALSTITACQAGKDVYVEKPCSHNVWEGKKMVDAARKYKRVVQVGAQTRSGEYTHEAVEYIRSGKLGPVYLVRVVNMKEWGSIGHKEDVPVPKGVNYDGWLGPAPKRAFNPNRFHYTWHWHWDYSGGDIINDAVHQIDAARYLIGQDYPTAVTSTGGKFSTPNDDADVPDTQVATWDFNNMRMVFELTLRTPYMEKLAWELRDKLDYYPDWKFDGMRVEVYGQKGLMYFERHGGGWQVFDEKKKVVAEANGHHPHYAHINNFFECIESRKKPNGDVEELHKSTILCQVANISYRLGGQRLEFDGKTETFVNNPEADKLLKRVGREPYVIPDEV
jgi:predicted dehydrogenase